MPGAQTSRIPKRWFLLAGLAAGLLRLGSAEPAPVADPFGHLPCIEEIDTATVAPVDELPAGMSRVKTILDRPARILPMGDEARRLVYRLGTRAGLVPGRLYLLEVEYPEDAPRAFFLANRGADLVRGWATGTAIGDARRQYVEPSVESLAYPLSGRWQRYRQFFVMHERLQGITGRRNADPGCRPFTAADGFHVVLFQTLKLNDPRSEGLAVGRLRLYAVPDPERLRAPLRRPPSELPQRRVFWREEMADQAISARDAADRAFADPLAWYAGKFRLAGLLGMDTFAKDLLEFGFNQGWESGDPSWVMNAQPPLEDLWTRLVPLATREGFALLPYYEYKGALGWSEARPLSLGWQRRAEKLYHGLRRTGDDARTNRYTGTWFTEDHNADLTDPETHADFRRVLERTVIRFKDQARFAGVWLRTRDNHLPVSFSDAAVARFRAAFPADPQATGADRAALIASYEGDHRLYDRYLAWWLDERARFLAGVQKQLAGALGGEPEVLFTPWTGEAVPALTPPDSFYGGVGLVTDDPAWWDAYAKTMTDGWYRWKWVPTPLPEVMAKDGWARTLSLRCPINDPGNWSHAEVYHSAPGADPERYRDVPGVMMTYPIGRLFTVAGREPISSYRARSGLSVVQHFALNENDEGWERMDAGTRLAQPFQNIAGYVSVDVDRAGRLALLNAARAVALADPRNIAFLCASSFSTGFPLELREFILAFQAVPALPSRIVEGAASDPEVVVREIKTVRHGTYYLVVNPSWNDKPRVELTFPDTNTLTRLSTGRPVDAGPLRVDLAPASLHAFHAAAKP